VHEQAPRLALVVVAAGVEYLVVGALGLSDSHLHVPLGWAGSVLRFGRELGADGEGEVVGDLDGVTAGQVVSSGGEEAVGVPEGLGGVGRRLHRHEGLLVAVRLLEGCACVVPPVLPGWGGSGGCRAGELELPDPQVLGGGAHVLEGSGVLEVARVPGERISQAVVQGVHAVDGVSGAPGPGLRVTHPAPSPHTTTLVTV